VDDPAGDSWQLALRGLHELPEMRLQALPLFIGHLTPLCEVSHISSSTYDIFAIEKIRGFQLPLPWF
jgi:hypothetical protein